VISDGDAAVFLQLRQKGGTKQAFDAATIEAEDLKGTGVHRGRVWTNIERMST
jgi:hypothetical protein